MGDNTNRKIPIKAEVLKADMRRQGVTASFLSRAIGMGETYVSDSIRAEAMGESCIARVAALFGSDPERYVLNTVTSKAPEPQNGVDWQLIVSAVAENGVAIKQLHQDLLRLYDLIESISENIIQNKLVTYTSQINARVKSIAEGPADPGTKATIDALKDIGSNVSSIRANSQRHYETQKTQIDKAIIEIKRKNE